MHAFDTKTGFAGESFADKIFRRVVFRAAGSFSERLIYKNIWQF